MMAVLPPGIHMIAAIGRRGQLGLDGGLPWHDPADLQWFKSVTMGCRLIAGVKTAAGLPKLHGREIWADDKRLTPGQMLAKMQPLPAEAIIVIGGARTYERWLSRVRVILLSRIDYDGMADTWMPELW